MAVVAKAQTRELNNELAACLAGEDACCARVTDACARVFLALIGLDIEDDDLYA